MLATRKGAAVGFMVVASMVAASMVVLVFGAVVLVSGAVVLASEAVAGAGVQAGAGVGVGAGPSRRRRGAGLVGGGAPAGAGAPAGFGSLGGAGCGDSVQRGRGVSADAAEPVRWLIVIDQLGPYVSPSNSQPRNKRIQTTETATPKAASLR